MFSKKIHDIFFKNCYINKNQTFAYQIMIIFMYVHYLKRLKLLKSFGYVGTNELYIKGEEEIQKLFSIVLDFISPQYIEELMSGDMKTFDDQFSYILGLMNIQEESKGQEKSEEQEENYLCEILIRNDGTIVFKIKNKGLSYQYNGYKKSEVKMSNKANLFAMLTVFGASFLWIEAKTEIIDNLPFGYIGLLIIYIYIFILYIFRKKFIFPWSGRAIGFFRVSIVFTAILIFIPKVKKIDNKKEIQSKSEVIININEINIK